MKKRKKGTGLHGNQGRKPKDDPRVNPVNIRLNSEEKAKFDAVLEAAGMSQADFVMHLINIYTRKEGM